MLKHAVRGRSWQYLDLYQQLLALLPSLNSLRVPQCFRPGISKYSLCDTRRVTKFNSIHIVNDDNTTLYTLHHDPHYHQNARHVTVKEK